jgi:hypothetical protein
VPKCLTFTLSLPGLHLVFFTSTCFYIFRCTPCFQGVLLRLSAGPFPHQATARIPDQGFVTHSNPHTFFADPTNFSSRRHHQFSVPQRPDGLSLLALAFFRGWADEALQDAPALGAVPADGFARFAPSLCIPSLADVILSACNMKPRSRPAVPRTGRRDRGDSGTTIIASSLAQGAARLPRSCVHKAYGCHL